MFHRAIQKIKVALFSDYSGLR